MIKCFLNLPDIYFFLTKIIKGIKKIKKINLPHILWIYSIQKINLKSYKFIFLLTNLYSGNCLYFSNNSIQSLFVSGGNIPEKIFHSTIDNPALDNRVKPPMNTIINIKAQQVISQN